MVPSTRLLMQADYEELSLRHAGLSGDAAGPLAAWLASNTTCEHLDMTRNRLGSHGVDALAEVCAGGFVECRPYAANATSSDALFRCSTVSLHPLPMRMPRC